MDRQAQQDPHHDEPPATAVHDLESGDADVCARSVLDVRCQDPGGWLDYGTASNEVPLLVFVPDPEHQWDGGALA